MADSASQASVAVQGLVKRYDPSPPWMRLLVRSNLKRTITAVDDVTFAMQPGEICTVLGPNGAGKTTIFRILVGLTTPTKGTSRVMGYDSVKEAVKVRRQVGWMPSDQRALLMRHSVQENLRFHGQLQGMDRADLNAAIGHTLELVGLQDWATSTCFALSAGMKARLQLARALLHRPRVLILDEPTGAVDPVASHELVNLIRDIVSERQIAALISSHKIEEIQALGSRVLMLDRGQLRYDGSLDSLKAKYAGPRLEIRFRSPQAAAEALLALKTADIGLVTRMEDLEVACELKANVTHANVLSLLSEQTEDIMSLQETETPLQAILANLYREAGGSS